MRRISEKLSALITKEERRQDFLITDDDLETIDAAEVDSFYVFYQHAGVNT
jgi:hypothetical protein